MSWALQEQDYGTALVHVDQAFQYAHLADDAHVKMASLIRKALTYRYINRYFKPCPYQIVEACQEAVQYSSSVLPLLRGRLYTGLSEAYSGLGQADEAKRALEQAYRIFPVKPQDDPNFSYTHFKLPQHFEAIMYLNLKQAEKAWELLAKVDTSIPMAVIPDRVELLMDQTRASLLLDELQQSCMYLELAVTSASALGSDLRYREASGIYRDMQVKWPHEQQVKALAEHFHL
jgi:tetratricopeptide (TPR) repeat protein